MADTLSDIWWLALSLLLITIIERDNIMNTANATWVNNFAIRQFISLALCDNSSIILRFFYDRSITTSAIVRFIKMCTVKLGFPESFVHLVV